MKLPFEVELSDKVIAITGAGGVICGEFARALAACGAKVALLDINFDAAKKIADEIGENAVAVRCNCLEVNAAFGKVNFLINGAGGNNPRATTDNETAAEAAQKDFFALDESGIKFVFDLNITTAFLVTQVFAEDMLETGGNIINISSMNAYRPLTKIPAYSAAKAGISRSGSRCILQARGSAAMRSHPDFSSPIRTATFCSTRTARRRRAWVKSWRRRP